MHLASESPSTHSADEEQDVVLLADFEDLRDVRVDDA